MCLRSQSFLRSLKYMYSNLLDCFSPWGITFLKQPIFTYSLTPWCTVLLEKLTGLQLVKKFHAFHGTRMFITARTSVRHLSLSWASPIQPIYPHPTSWRSVLILSTHLRLGLPSGLFPSGFPTKTLYTPLSSPIRATCPAHLILLDFITLPSTNNALLETTILRCHVHYGLPATGPRTVLQESTQHRHALFL